MICTKFLHITCLRSLIFESDELCKVSNFATEFLKRKDGQHSIPIVISGSGGGTGTNSSNVGGNSKKKGGKKGNTEF